MEPLNTPEVPVSQPAPTPAPMQSASVSPQQPARSFGVMWAVVIGLLVVVGGAYSWMRLNPSSPSTQETPTPSPSPTASASTTPDTTGWKTYTNTKYGYSFEYPSDWTVVLGGSNDMSMYATEQVFLRSPATTAGVAAKTINLGYSYDLVVSFFNDSSVWAGDAGGRTYSGTTTMVGSQIAKDYIIGGQGQSYAAVIELSPRLWELNFMTAWDKTILTDSQKQILATFKFTDTTVFMNDAGGYTFRYPREWGAFANSYVGHDTLFGVNASAVSGPGGIEMRDYAGSVAQFMTEVEAQYSGQTNVTVAGLSGIRAHYTGSGRSGTAYIIKRGGQIINVYLNSDKSADIALLDALVLTLRFPY